METVITYILFYLILLEKLKTLSREGTELSNIPKGLLLGVVIHHWCYFFTFQSSENENYK